MKYFLFLLAITGCLISATPAQRIYPVEVKSYLLSDKQIIEAGNIYAHNNNVHFDQWTFHQLKNNPTFIVIFAKNQGEAFVSGTLIGNVSGRIFELPVFGLPKSMTESAVWIIPVGNTYLGEGSALPQIKMEWKDFKAE